MFYFNFNFLSFFLMNFFLFFYGISGLFATRRNLILVFVCIELILLAGVSNFSLYGVFLDDIFGLIFALFILGVGAAEAAIGLALLVSNYRHKAIISIDLFSALKN